MSGPVRSATLHPTVFVAPGAVVLGDVTLEARSSVWFNTVIRGDSDRVVVGEGTNLQDNSVVHEDDGFPTLIGDRVTVGHRAIIHGCVIEDDCLIGMGSVVLSGARIGTGSLIGASSLVRENQIIPPGSLVVGSPARVVGPVTDQHRASIQNGTAHYAELARFYMMRGLARGANRRGEVADANPPMTPREWERLVSSWTPDPLQDDVRLAWIEAALNGADLTVMDEKTAAHTKSPASRGLTDRLRRLGPNEWIRPIGHPTRGARTLADWVREWADEDVVHRRESEGRVEGRT